MKKRLSVCYAAPGHSLVTTSGTTRNILSLARALSEWADVTVAFRDLPEAGAAVDPAIKLMSIENGPKRGNSGVDDEATRGVNPLAHLAYLRSVRRFARESARSFDLVFEKGWRLSGFALRRFSAMGVPGAVIENDARCWTDTGRDLRTKLKWILHSGAQRASGYYSRKAPLIIAETEELKDLLFLVRRIPLEKIRVVPLGVDHRLFRPMDQAAARATLSLSPGKTVMLYVGGMDKYHDLTPLLESLQVAAPADFELHVVGEGEFRPVCEEKARKARAPVVFHGRVPHEDVPRYIAASDVCIAPYRAEAFFNHTVTFSTLKIPEYMACERAVASIPSGEIKRLIKPGVSGFLFPNSVAGWRGFLERLPEQPVLRTMGVSARRAVEGRSWEQTAKGYLQACAEHIRLPGHDFPLETDAPGLVRG